MEILYSVFIMTSVINFVKKNKIEILLQLALVVIAAVSFGITIADYPLVDYDEATYAKVVVDTLESGAVLSFTLSGNDWFEKPPLYLWFAMGATKIFGAEEFAFRLPAVLFAIVTLWFVYLIVIELTKSRVAAAVAFLILLFSAPFFVFARETRLDSGVTMAMLAALYFFIKGWNKEKFLFWIAPAIAIGFLFKSAVAFLILPIILLYSFFYKQWAWVKNKYLWTGFIASIVLLAPWHILQSIRFGMSFWNDYLFHQIFKRAVTTITGSSNYNDYLNVLWFEYNPWTWAIIIIGVILLSLGFLKELRSKIPWGHIFAPLLSAIFILGIFTMARTHLTPYIMPMFPFLVMFMVLSLYYFRKSFENVTYVIPIFVLVFIILGAVISFGSIDALVTPAHYEEREISRIYKNLNENQGSLYVFDWPHHETLSYYGDIDNFKFIDSRVEGEKVLKAPFDLIVINNSQLLSPFFNPNGTLLEEYEYLELLFVGKNLLLIHSTQDLRLPSYSHLYQ